MSHTLLLADVFENFRKICLKIYQLNPAKYLSAPRLAWQADFKKTEAKLELPTNVDMLLMIEKQVTGWIFTLITDMHQLIINIWKIVIKIKNHHLWNIGT